MYSMKQMRLNNKDLAKWIVISVTMTGALYLIFFLFLLHNRSRITIPAPPDIAKFLTPTIAPTDTPAAPPTLTPTPVLFCGGIGGVRCPSGFSCRLSGAYPDAGGYCIKNL